MGIDEKLSILTELIGFAKSDGKIKDVEYNFLLSIAQQIGVNKDTFDKLFKNPAPKVVLPSESQRIVQFHRLLLLMNVDQVIEDEELEKIHQLGLKMGLNIQAIDKTLDVMPQYKNNIVPPNVLLDIFKTYYN
ncbi:TerB family tellurite resistance protein [Pseudofulvibacter geojedonensis]|uniref:TerB family tellurite resistance protein n=1 Tax=Pseudofulvibacter geojedonensis TaxID=1123758 RepID=A0ABW3HZJ6_9FLAO